MDKTQIRAASTIIMVRNKTTNPKVLMGQRGKSAAFMPNKFVFPGGAVDVQDTDISLITPLNPECRSRLQARSKEPTPEALAVAAIRELWEETGLRLAAKSDQNQSENASSEWSRFYKNGRGPSAEHLKFIFRAITPPARPRRFDARFFMVDADYIEDDLDDFSEASDELSHLQWIHIQDTKNFDLPRITTIVMHQVSQILEGAELGVRVPFFDQTVSENANLYFL